MGHRITIGRVVATTALVFSSAAMIVGGVSAATPHATPRATPRTTVACTNAATDSWINTRGNGTAGSSYYHLEFTNLGTTACTLSGYPGVSAVSLSGMQLGPAGTRISATWHAVTVGAHETVSAQLQIVVAENFTSSACGVTWAAGLKIYAPNETAGRISYFPFPTCRHTSVVLHVGPVT